MSFENLNLYVILGYLRLMTTVCENVAPNCSRDGQLL